VISIAPDRVALFGYAHVPWMKKHQQMIREDDLPGALERFEQAEMAAAMLCEAGYERIGIDHFAKPADPLAQAAREGRLHRNFQGYVTDSCETLIGLGASSIGRFAGGYVQNIVATGQYQTAVANAHLPAAKGLALTQDDHVRGWMIERLMCDFEIRFDALQACFGSVASGYAWKRHAALPLPKRTGCAKPMRTGSGFRRRTRLHADRGRTPRCLPERLGRTLLARRIAAATPRRPQPAGDIIGDRSGRSRFSSWPGRDRR
jgi:coproporphyrinogen III oxidase-like Fe-S oxidoreductase